MMHDEREIASACQQLSGFGPAVGLQAEFGSMEARDWSGFAFNRSLLVRDFSALRHFANAALIRPLCIQVGDEDAFSSGSDWIRRLNATNVFAASGISANFAWMSADKRCHEGGLVTKPYAMPLLPTNPTFHPDDAILDLIANAVAARSTPASPTGAIVPAPAPNSIRDADQGSEWVWGRRYVPPPVSGALVEDTTFFVTAQPDWVGTHLGHQESIVISGGRVVVGSAEGCVTALTIPGASPPPYDAAYPGDPLVVVARARPRDPNAPSNFLPAGTPLGHNAFGLARLGTGFVVGTRRHLVKLDANLDEVARVDLPWQDARPYRIQVADVLNTVGFSGQDILVVSGNGGMLVFDQNLTASPFAYREPGIRDVVVPSVSYAQATTASKQAISVLSERGVVANLTLGPNVSTTHAAELHAVSRPFEDTPLDLERQFVGSQEFLLALVGTPPRLLCMDALTLVPQWEQSIVQAGGAGALGLSGALDMATVKPTATGDDAVVGEHIVVLYSDTLYLFNESGQFLARKNLNTYVPALGATAIAVGELAPGGPAGPYSQEIVIATATGHVVWFHLNEIVAASSTNSLPVALVTGGDYQPRTNRALACTWGISANVSPLFDVLDQSGVHWQIGNSAVATLVANAAAVPGGGTLPVGGTRGWSAAAVPTSASAPSTAVVPLLGGVLTTAGVSIPPEAAIYQLQTSIAAQPVWFQGLSLLRASATQFLWSSPGDIIADSAGYQIHRWANATGYGDLVEGLHITSASNTIAGRWATTVTPPNSNGTPNLPFTNLRSPSAGSAYVDAQALRAFRVPSSGGPSSAVRLALGCPGGRLRVLEPGQPNVTNSVGAIRVSSQDLGTGGAALAIRPAADGVSTDIFFGTLTNHAARGSYPADLTDASVLSGTVAWYRYSESGGAGTLTQLAFRELLPTATDRGGFGVVGLAVGDLLDNPGEELVVTTLAGDLFVFSLANNTISAQPLYRTWVPGGLGLYNSIQIRDLDPFSTGPELYIASSLGLRKWKRP